MAFEFLSSLDTTTAFLLLIIFILFVLSMKKVFSIILNVVWISIASILFPVVMNRFLGFNIPTDAESLISFVLLGLTLYFIYLIGRSIYKTLKFTESAAKKVLPKIDREKKKKEAKSEKDDGLEEDYRDREKELKQRERELKKQEQQVRWKSAMESGKSKKKSYDEKEYVMLKEKKKSPYVEPLPVIKKKKKPK